MFGPNSNIVWRNPYCHGHEIQVCKDFSPGTIHDIFIFVLHEVPVSNERSMNMNMGTRSFKLGVEILKNLKKKKCPTLGVNITRVNKSSIGWVGCEIIC